MADETDPVLEELLRQQSPFQRFQRPEAPFAQPDPGADTVYTTHDVNNIAARNADRKPNLLQRILGWGKDLVPTPGQEGAVAPVAPQGNMAQLREQFRQNPQGVAAYQHQALTDEGNRESFSDRITHAPQRAFNIAAGVPDAVLHSGEHYAGFQKHDLGEFDPAAVAIPPQAAFALAPGLKGLIARGEAAGPSMYSSLEAWADKKGLPVPRDFQRPAAGTTGLDRFSSVIQPKEINIWPGEENLTPGYPANKIDQNPLTPGAAMSRRLLQEHLGVTHFPKPPALEGIIDRLPGALDKQALETAGKEVTGRTRDNDASINHRVLKAEGDNKVGALISTQDIMRQLEDLKLQGTPRVSGGGTTYIRVNDPINPDTPSLKVRVPPPDNLHGGKPNYREIDTSIEGTRHLHAGQTNAARQPYQGDIGRVRKALEFAFGRNLVSPGEEPGFTRYKTETQPPQPKELPNPDQMKLLARGDKHLMFGGSLGSHTEIGTKMPDADFWITRRGADGKLGEVSREYNPESFGVLNRNHQIDPDYLRYALEHVKNQGYYAGRGHGTTNLKNIRLKDVEDIPIQPSDFRLDAKGGDLRQILASARQDPARKAAIEKAIDATKGVSHSGRAKIFEDQFGIPKTGERWWEAKDWGASGRPLKRYYGDSYGPNSSNLGSILSKAADSLKDDSMRVRKVPKVPDNYVLAREENKQHVRQIISDLGENHTASKIWGELQRRHPDVAAETTPEALRLMLNRNPQGFSYNPGSNSRIADPVFADQFRKAWDRHGGDQGKVATELGVSNAAVSRWKGQVEGLSERAGAPHRPVTPPYGPRPSRVEAAGEARRQKEGSEAELAKRNGKPFWDEQGRADAQQKDLEAARRAVEQLTGKKPDDTTLYARENKPWLPAETDKLRELHEKAALEGGNLDSIAKEMGRTTTTIWNRMQRLGLGRLNRGRFEGNGVPRDLFAGETRPTREQLNARDEAAVQRLFGKGD